MTHSNEHRNHSLLWRTIAAIVIVLVVFVAGSAWFSYDKAQTRALAAQDAELAEVAAALARANVTEPIPGWSGLQNAAAASHMHGRGHGRMGRGMGMGRRMMGSNRQCPTCVVNELNPNGDTLEIPAGTDLIVHVRHPAENVVLSLKQSLKGGFSTLTIANEPHRLCVVILPTGSYSAVADPLSIIEEEAAAEAFSAVLPYLVLLPLLVLAVGFVLWRAFGPLRSAAKDIRARDATNLTPLACTNLPSEALPFVEAVNGLLERVQSARDREMRFTADAAHELRSPLTSLLIEAEHLGKLQLPVDARVIVSNLAQGLDRTIHQVSQLLLFARAQAGETQKILLRDSEPWYLSEVIGGLLEPMLDMMSDKDIHFRVEGLEENEESAEKPLEGVSRTAFEAILRNLLENALRYTPHGGTISVHLARTDKELHISVKDSGPGIPKAERERVFDPFYRIAGTKVPGTGLGLAIVKTYADMIGAVIELSDADPTAGANRGLCAHVLLPCGVSSSQA